ncbi:MAG: sigma 54-interacting transcriptional regulator [Deltaproteobacteria bacterium]|nr:sigma 54-interacting transcriptional regulator [Deltaproteobacteria bacterium]
MDERMKLRVLFLSSGEPSRCRMAQGFLQSKAADEVLVQSAGALPDTLHPIAAKVMAEKSIDISRLSSESVANLADSVFDLVVIFGERAGFAGANGESGESEGERASRATPALGGVPLRLFWQVPDPAAGKGTEQAVLETFREVRDQIERRVDDLLNQGLIFSIADARQRMDSILDLLEDGVIAHDGSRRISAFNRAAELITGYSREEVIGRDCHQALPPSGICQSQCAFLEGLPGEFVRFERSTPFTTKNGAIKLLKTVASTTGSDATNPGYVVLCIRDMTELTQLRSEFKDKYSFQNMVGISKAMQEVFEAIRLVSFSDYPVLVSGESGTGKELVAHAIHNESRRKGAPFVPVNCGALPDHILESELFGHVRGAFTGATRDRKGRFELADGGTLFLDEVAELSPSFQVKLLRVLQEMRFEKVGGERSVQVDVRVISATNRDLRRMVKEGSFREDLFYRLCVMPIHLPPLRDRREDIPILIQKSLRTISQETGKTITAVEAETMDVLIAYPWPGNIRELINTLRFAALRCKGPEIMVHHLPPELQNESDEREMMDSWGSEPPSGYPSDRPPREKLTVESVQNALLQTKGSKTKAAKLLGIGRATLYRFLDRYSVNYKPESQA